MSTEEQRARNARKRAKLKAHRRGLLVPETKVPLFMWEFAVRGIKCPFGSECQDAALDEPTLPAWVNHYDYLPMSVVAGADADLDELKSKIRERVEIMYGFNEHDLDVKFINRYWYNDVTQL